MDSRSSSGTPLTSSKRLSSSIPDSSSSFTTSAGFGERRRKRSNTISGPHPLEVPITQSDHELASLIDRLNIQNARAAAAEAAAAAAHPAQSIPQVLLPLTYRPGSTESREAGNQTDLEGEKTPTQEDFIPTNPPLCSSSPVEENKSLQPPRGRAFSYSSSVRILSPTADDSSGGAKTPTRYSPTSNKSSPNTSPTKTSNDEASIAEAFPTDRVTQKVDSAAFPPFDLDFPLTKTAQAEGPLAKRAGIEVFESESSTGEKSLAKKGSTRPEDSNSTTEDSILQNSTKVTPTNIPVDSNSTLDFPPVGTSTPSASLSSKTTSDSNDIADN